MRSTSLSKYSELLAELCRKRNISSELLSKLSGVERTQTYRLLKGTRKPSGAEQIRKINRVLKLSIQESEELNRALQVDSVGYKVFERREYLNRIFQDLSFLSVYQSNLSFDNINSLIFHFVFCIVFLLFLDLCFCSSCLVCLKFFYFWFLRYSNYPSMKFMTCFSMNCCNTSGISLYLFMYCSYFCFAM